MQLHYPLNPTTGLEDQTQLPWTNGVPSTGTEGSYPPFALMTDPQTELVNLITLAGITPADSDMDQVTRAVRGGQLDFDATDTGSADAVICQVGLAHTQIAAGLPFTFIKGPNANATPTPTLTITDLSGNNGLTGSIVKSGGGALVKGDLPANALITVRARAPGVFSVISMLLISDVLALIAAAVPAPLTINTTVYVNASTGNDTTGLGTALYPFQTLQATATFVQKTFSTGPFTVTIAATGAFTAGVTVNGGFPGSQGPGSVVFSFTGGSSVIVAGTNGCCFKSNYAGAFTINGGLTISAPGSNGIGIYSNGGNIVWSGVVFGACGNAHVLSGNGGFATASGNYTIAGNASQHWSVTNFGEIQAAAITITLSGTPAFSAYFAYCLQGLLYIPSLTFSGSATGYRYYVDGFGIINTGGAASTYIPGSGAGTATATGSYR